MSVVRNGVKVQQWTDRLSRFRRGGQTVAAFCQSEGVSEASFYLWKRKLAPPAERTGKRSTSSEATSSEATSSEPTSSGPASSRPTCSGLAFQTVALVSTSASATTVRLPRGIEIELGTDLRVIEAIVKQLLAEPAAAEGGEGGGSC